jgi:tRNA threonylcarbamoyl adenosine modification protein (Sua5/YciO/YrdC/YwlC family)
VVLKVAKVALGQGRMVIFPTDTVYGIGLLVSQDAQPKRLFAAKQRAKDKPVALLMSKPQELAVYGRDVPPYAHALAAQHWPGALTLVVKAADNVPRQFCAADGSVALRVPNSGIALGLLRQVDGVIATSSANISGESPAMSITDLDSRLMAQAALIIDGGCLTGCPSTLISCLEAQPRILRQGRVSI